MLPLLYDHPDSQARLGIHAFCKAILELMNTTSEWVKASRMAIVIRRLLESLGILIAENGLISKGGLALALVLVTLGSSTLGQDYAIFVRMAVSLQKQAVGIGGECRGNAFFVVGYPMSCWSPSRACRPRTACLIPS
jgi:hypothetical protein